MDYVVIETKSYSPEEAVAYACDSYKTAAIKVNTRFQRRLKEELKNGSSIDQQYTYSKEGYARITWMDGRYKEYRLAKIVSEK